MLPEPGRATKLAAARFAHLPAGDMDTGRLATLLERPRASARLLVDTPRVWLRLSRIVEERTALRPLDAAGIAELASTNANIRIALAGWATQQRLAAMTGLAMLGEHLRRLLKAAHLREIARVLGEDALRFAMREGPRRDVGSGDGAEVDIHSLLERAPPLGRLCLDAWAGTLPPELAERLRLTWEVDIGADPLSCRDSTVAVELVRRAFQWMESNHA